MRTKDRIQEIVNLRQDLLNELKSLQEACPHSEYYLGAYSWRVGSYDTMRICTECNSCFEKPSDEEFTEYTQELKDEYFKSHGYEHGQKPPNADPNICYVTPYLHTSNGSKVYTR